MSLAFANPIYIESISTIRAVSLALTQRIKSSSVGSGLGEIDTVWVGTELVTDNTK